MKGKSHAHAGDANRCNQRRDLETKLVERHQHREHRTRIRIARTISKRIGGSFTRDSSHRLVRFPIHWARRTPTVRIIIAPRTWNPYLMIRSKVISFAVISWLLLSFCFIRSNSSFAGYEKWKTKPRSDYHARIKHLTERETQSNFAMRKNGLK